jgi:hypothetical protein
MSRNEIRRITCPQCVVDEKWAMEVIKAVSVPGNRS